MNKKILITILALIMFAAIIGIAKAQLEVQIEVKDSNGNSIDGETVFPNTVAYVNGTYKDLKGDAPASALMQVYYDDDLSTPDWKLKETLFNDTVKNGQNIERNYTMTELGYYQFRWRCTKESGASELSILCVGEVGFKSALVHAVPEPGTLAGLITALSAFGLLAVKRIRTK